MPDLEQIITAPVMQPASPNRIPAIRIPAIQYHALTPAKLRRFRKSRSCSPETGAIGTPNAHCLASGHEPDGTLHLATLDSCYTISPCKSGASLFVCLFVRRLQKLQKCRLTKGGTYTT